MYKIKQYKSFLKPYFIYCVTITVIILSLKYKVIAHRFGNQLASFIIISTLFYLIPLMFIAAVQHIKINGYLKNNYYDLWNEMKSELGFFIINNKTKKIFFDKTQIDLKDTSVYQIKKDIITMTKMARVIPFLIFILWMIILLT